MRPLFLSVLLLTSSATIAAEGEKQVYQCPNGSVIETTVKGSREQRKKTADLRIEQVRVKFDDLPGWQNKTSPESLLEAIQSNCITKKLPEGWGKVCKQLESAEPKDVYRYIERNFVPHQLVVESSNKGKFTSYYASYVSISKTKSDTYKYPIYRFSKKAKALSRTEISAGALPQADVLFWSDNAFDNYILHVQGSGVGKLPDGTKVKILYAGKNTENYVSLGKVLRECGEIAPDKISLPSIKAWVNQATWDEYQRLINNNQSYVFFTEERYDQKSPKGALGVPLTPMRSLAVDTRYIPLGTMAYVAVPHPLSDTMIEQVFIAQDKGGAINGGIRADIFAGEGDQAADFAGRMAHQGQLWLIKPK